MSGILNIFILNTILLAFHLTDSQPSTLRRIWATANEHCIAHNEFLVSLHNLTNTVSLSTNLLIRRIWSSVARRYTPWIASIGCFEIDRIPEEHLFHQHAVLNNTVEGCYCECHKENISCGQNELSFFLKGSLCFCICKVHRVLAQSNKCNESCSSDRACPTDNFFNVYTECKYYVMEKTRPDGFCLLCSKADLDTNDFGCDEPIGLCAEREDVCYSMKKKNSNLNYSKLHCTQQLPLVCVKQNDTDNHWTNITTIAAESSNCNTRPVTNDIVVITAASSSIIAASVVVFVVLYCGILRRRWHAKSHRHTDKRDIHLEEVTSKQCTSIDSNLQNVYHIIEPTTENSCNPEANHYYDRIKHLGQKTEYQYEKDL